jgi:hypothetical protein
MVLIKHVSVIELEISEYDINSTLQLQITKKK